MKMKFFILITITSFLLSCGNNSKKVSQSVEKEKPITINIEKEKELESEIQKLQEQGIFGKWECDFAGYESIIFLRKEGNSFSSLIDFTKSNSKSKNESLIKEGNKYLVSGSKAKEYYKINSDGNLELWDKDGLFTTAVNIMPGQKSKSLSELNLKNTIGQNIFTIAGNYSKSSPKTLNGTNNEYWIVYYKDINVTFKVYKKTDSILKAQKGEFPE